MDGPLLGWREGDLPRLCHEAALDGEAHVTPDDAEVSNGDAWMRSSSSPSETGIEPGSKRALDRFRACTGLPMVCFNTPSTPAASLGEALRPPFGWSPPGAAA